jgi:hypothetical protein
MDSLHKDEKCFKLLPSTIFATRDGAEELCNRQVTENSDDMYVSTLIEIISADEQKLLEQYLFWKFSSIRKCVVERLLLSWQRLEKSS